MLKIVEKVCDEPIRMLVHPGIKLQAGYIAKIVDFEGDLVCTVYDGEGSPFGVIGQRKLVKGDRVVYHPKQMVNIWAQRMIFRTDRYESIDGMEEGGKLYVSRDGLLTARVPWENYSSPYVARITRVPRNEEDKVEALWL